MIEVGCALSGDAQRAAAFLTVKPTERFHSREQRPSKAAAKVRTPGAPVEAGPAKRCARGFELRQVNAKAQHFGASRVRQGWRLWRACDGASSAQRVIELHAPIPGKVIITAPRMAQRRVARTGACAQASLTGGKAHERLQHRRDLWPGERDIFVPPLLAMRHKSALFEARDVAARGLGADARLFGQFTRCKSAPPA